jgi:hypothetical protein
MLRPVASPNRRPPDVLSSKTTSGWFSIGSRPAVAPRNSVPVMIARDSSA